MRKRIALVIIVIHLAGISGFPSVHSSDENTAVGSEIIRIGCGTVPILTLVHKNLVEQLRVVTLLSNLASKIAQEQPPQQQNPLSTADSTIVWLAHGSSLVLERDDTSVAHSTNNTFPIVNTICSLFIILFFQRKRLREHKHAFSLARDDTDSSVIEIPRYARRTPHRS